MGYTVVFETTNTKENGILRACNEMYGGGNTSFSIRTVSEPSSNILLDFVYGTLSQNMNEMHLTHHLIHDDITTVLQPKKLVDIQNCDDRTPEEAVAVANFNELQAIQNPSSISVSFKQVCSNEFGRLLYRLESQAGASIKDFGVYTEKNIVLFYDQVAIFQVEKRIMCWPAWYTQDVVPKYQFKSMNIAKTDPTFFFSVGMILFIGGLVPIIMKKIVAIGALLLVFSLPCFLLPCILSNFDVQFEIARVKDSGFVRAFRACCCFIGGGSEYITIRCPNKPDANKMMAYVYGPLRPYMGAAHSLNHLIHDDVTFELQPSRFNDVGKGGNDDADEHTQFLNKV